MPPQQEGHRACSYALISISISMNSVRDSFARVPEVCCRWRTSFGEQCRTHLGKRLSHQATVYMRETMRTYKSIEEYSSRLKDMRPLLSEAVARQLARGSLRACEGGFELKLDPALINYADDELTSAAQWRELLPQIGCPTLVVRGAGSAMVTARAAKEMIRLLPRAQLVTIPRSGHAVMSDNPPAFCASVAGFVRALLSTPKP